MHYEQNETSRFQKRQLISAFKTAAAITLAAVAAVVAAARFRKRLVQYRLTHLGHVMAVAVVVQRWC